MSKTPADVIEQARLFTWRMANRSHILTGEEIKRYATEQHTALESLEVAPGWCSGDDFTSDPLKVHDFDGPAALVTIREDT